MLCDCRDNLSAELRPPCFGQAPPPFRFKCLRCGGPFRMVDPLDAMLGKLSQLARFGLGAGSRPLLISTRQEG